MTQLGRVLAGLDPRRSFAGKLLAALVGTLAIVLGAALAAVRAETAAQVDRSAARAAAVADTTFRSIEALQRVQLAEVAGRVAGGTRIPAALEAAMESREIDPLFADVDYELELSQIPRDRVLVVLTDPDGRTVVARAGGRLLPGEDPGGVRSLVDRMYDQNVPDMRAYRVVDGRVYNLHTAFLALGNRPVGTFSLGLPIDDETARQLGSVVGAAVCFVAEGRCVAGTSGMEDALRERLVRTADDQGPRRVRDRTGRWSLSSTPLDPTDASIGRRAMAVPLDPVLEPFDHISRTLGLAALVAAAISALLGTLIAGGLARPVRALVHATGRVARGDYDAEVSVGSADELGALARSFNEMTQGLRLKERYRGVLNKVVSPDVAEELMKGGVELGGENRDVTVLFADIRGFTPLTEGMEPQAVIRLLNECMAVLSSAVDAEGGVVDKYVGDQIMAVFGAPGQQPDHAARALRAAVRMRAGIARMNADRIARGDPAIRIGVGVNTGTAVAGNMGSPERLNYTVLGDAVNLASRLCSAAAPDQVLASRETVRAAGAVSARSLGERELKGFSSGIEVLAVDEAPAPPAGAERPAREPAAPSRAGLALLAVLMGASLAFAPAPLRAQNAESGLPTLADLGLWWESPTGRYQVGLSGRLDLEAYHPTGAAAGLMSDRSDFAAGRARLFFDAFAGERFYGSAELRVDRGETPMAGSLEARLEQAFVRAGLSPIPVQIQLGRFASPFGAYPSRHHTTTDYFIRPPLLYDQHTVLSTSVVPPNASGFLGWRDRPEVFRAVGAPTVWNVPYQWGAMALLDVGPVDVRAAWMNSAPSSAPGSWDWDGDRLRHGSQVLGAEWAVVPELRVGASWSQAPFLEPPLANGALPAGTDRWDYRQYTWGLDAAFSRGPAIVRGELYHDGWEIPNVRDEATELAWYLEAQSDVVAGVWLAARYGAIAFGDLESSTGTPSQWDYDVSRVQLGAGYRIVRNAELKLEWLRDRRSGPFDRRADLLSAQIWWAY